MPPSTSEAARQGDLTDNSQADIETLAAVPASYDAHLGGASAEHLALLRRLHERRGWHELTPLQRQRATELVLAAECPSLGIITTNIEELCARLDWTQGMRQKTVRALKDARLLSVFRQRAQNPETGTWYELRPATFSVRETDEIPAAQRPLKRAKRRSRRRVKPAG